MKDGASTNLIFLDWILKSIIMRLVLSSIKCI